MFTRTLKHSLRCLGDFQRAWLYEGSLVIGVFLLRKLKIKKILLENKFCWRSKQMGTVAQELHFANGFADYASVQQYDFAPLLVQKHFLYLGSQRNSSRGASFKTPNSFDSALATGALEPAIWVAFFGLAVTLPCRARDGSHHCIQFRKNEFFRRR